MVKMNYKSLCMVIIFSLCSLDCISVFKFKVNSSGRVVRVVKVREVEELDEVEGKKSIDMPSFSCFRAISPGGPNDSNYFADSDSDSDFNDSDSDSDFNDNDSDGVSSLCSEGQQGDQSPCDKTSFKVLKRGAQPVRVAQDPLQVAIGFLLKSTLKST